MKRNLLIFTAIFGAVILTTCKKDDPAPVANFVPSKTTAAVNTAITFTNSSTNATSYLWSFGDGNSSAEMNPSHTYTTAGTFTVLLTATGKGGSNSTSKDITITYPPLEGNWTGSFYMFSTNWPFNFLNVSQSGTALDGYFQFTDGSGYTEFSSSSKITGKSFNIKWSAVSGSSTISFVYAGTVNDDFDSMSGTMTVNGTSVSGVTATKDGTKSAKSVEILHRTNTSNIFENIQKLVQ
jgi:PKD repeat protein